MKKINSTPKWVLVAIALSLLGVFGLKAVFFLTAKSKITVNYVAEYNKISRPQDYNPNDNAAVNYQKAFEAFFNIPVELAKRDVIWITDFSQAEQIILEQWLASNLQAFNYFRQAAAKPYYWLERETEENMADMKLPEFHSLRRLTEAILWDAKLKAANGKHKPAFENVIDCYNAGQQKCRSNLLLMEQHNGIYTKNKAMDCVFIILKNEDIEAEALNYFQNVFQRNIDKDNYTPSIKSEMYLLYDALQRTFIDNGKGTGRLAWNAGWHMEMVCGNRSNISRRLYACLIGPNRKTIIEECRKILDMSEQLMTKKPWQIENETTDFFAEIESINRGNWFLELFDVNPKNIYHLHHKTRARSEALTAIIAALRYEIDTKQYPETLNELVFSGYLQAVPDDPYGNNPLIYGLTKNGFKLYSIGENFEDNGGTTELDIVYWHVE